MMQAPKRGLDPVLADARNRGPILQGKRTRSLRFPAPSPAKAAKPSPPPKKYHTPSSAPVSLRAEHLPAPEEIVIDGVLVPFWECLEISDHRRDKKGVLTLRVAWEGDHPDTWEPLHMLCLDAPAMVERCICSHPAFTARDSEFALPRFPNMAAPPGEGLTAVPAPSNNGEDLPDTMAPPDAPGGPSGNPLDVMVINLHRDGHHFLDGEDGCDPCHFQFREDLLAVMQEWLDN